MKTALKVTGNIIGTLLTIAIICAMAFGTFVAMVDHVGIKQADEVKYSQDLNQVEAAWADNYELDLTSNKVVDLTFNGERTVVYYR